MRPCESASGRRRFLDRLVWALEPAHAREAAAHETAVASRNKLLAQRQVEAAWLAGLANLGASAQLVMYYEGSPGGFPGLVIENNPLAVTEWQMLYQTLTTR